MSQASNIDLRLLPTLEVLLEERSVTRAAARLGVTQSAVSHALRELRATTGDALLVRSGRAMVPTPFALGILPPLQRGLQELRRAFVAEESFDPARSRRPLSLALPGAWLYTVLPGLIARLREQAPAMRLDVRTLSPDVVDELANGRLDLVLAPAELEAPLNLGRDMMRKLVASETYACVFRSAHPALEHDFGLPRYLDCTHVVIELAGRRSERIDDVLKGMGGVRTVGLTVPNYLAAAYAAAGSDLVSTMPRSLADWAAPRLGIELRPAPVKLPHSESCLWWHPSFQTDPAHSWWRQFVITAFAGQHKSGSHAPSPKWAKSAT
ncbi:MULTISPECIES: LysR family transcriptional regulator [Rhodomicrobium]|uniref:LysR family transcriptional regulator n=1 Tax=Rhodomicrobium TaxID=1068 RepID=UPI001482DD75|nr:MULTISPECIES: LysR family transcriptional regulator [Rhodomicrobium]